MINKFKINTKKRMFKNIVGAALAAYVSASQKYNIDCMPFPENRHVEMDQVAESVQWDRKAHLEIVDPDIIHTLDFDRLPYPTHEEHNLAYSAPFKVVSDEGVTKLREVIDHHKHRKSSNGR